MRLLVDGCVFSNTYQRGIQRYYYEFLKRIGCKYEIELFLSKPAPVQLPASCKVIQLPRYLQSSGWTYVPRVWRMLVRKYWRYIFGGHDLFQSTYYTESPEQSIPEVTSVYDMIITTDSCFFSAKCRRDFSRLQFEAMYRANAIICISHSTANEVQLAYPTLAHKTHVIYPGADHLFNKQDCQTGTSQIKVDRRYALFVGTRAGYKNFSILLDALTCSIWPKGLALVVVGPVWNTHETRVVEKLEHDGRLIHLGRVSDEQLRQLYVSADTFIFPSLCEGFGFPLIEAQFLSCPVVCSDIQVFHEVAGQAAEYFAPHSAVALCNAVTKALHKSERKRLIENGLTNAHRFTWHNCAKQWLGFYEKLIR